MSLLYKDNWEETKQRYLDWWNYRGTGRCMLSVTAPRAKAPDLPKPPEPKTPQEKWLDLESVTARAEWRLARTWYGGEAVPVWHPGYPGYGAIPTFVGCKCDLDMETGWWNPTQTDPNGFDWRAVRIDKSCPAYQWLMKLLTSEAQRCKGKCVPSIGAFGSGGDIMAAVRGTEQLLFDCIERPADVRAAEDSLAEQWCDFYDGCHSITRQAGEGTSCWFELWSPGKFYAPQNDFAYNVSPAMFCELFLPSIARQTEHLDHSVYHVDGVGNFVHVPALLELPKLQAYQILPGAGKPSPLHYMDTLKQVQAAGKNLWIQIEAGEVEAALRQLSARGLYIRTTCKTQAQGERLLRDAERWSVIR